MLLQSDSIRWKASANLAEVIPIYLVFRALADPCPTPARRQAGILLVRACIQLADVEMQALQPHVMPRPVRASTRRTRLRSTAATAEHHSYRCRASYLVFITDGISQASSSLIGRRQNDCPVSTQL